MTSKPTLNGHIETTPCRYGTMAYIKSDDPIGSALKEYGEWAQSEIDLLSHFIKPGDIVIDVGAFIGTHTLAFSKLVGKAGLVYSFEPQPLAFEVLSLNVCQNSLSNVRLFNRAVSSEDARVNIGEIPSDWVNHGAIALSAVLATDLHGTTSSIETMMLDGLQVDRCKVIKIDVEGMEFSVLSGARDLLRTCRPIVFAECLSVQDGARILQFMNEMGYGGFLSVELAFNPANFRGSRNNIFGDAREANILFIPSERVDEFKLLVREDGDISRLDVLDDLVVGLIRKPQYRNEVLKRAGVTDGVYDEIRAKENERRLNRILSSRAWKVSAFLGKIWEMLPVPHHWKKQ